MQGLTLLLIFAILIILSILINTVIVMIAAAIMQPPRMGFLPSLYASSFWILINGVICLIDIFAQLNISDMTWFFITSIIGVISYAIFFQAGLFTASMLYVMCFIVSIVIYFILSLLFSDFQEKWLQLMS